MPHSSSPSPLAALPVIVPRQEHGISRKQIDEDTLKVLYRLSRAGFKAYLVGGGVRDLLLGRQPKDFDVATDATPEEVRALFRNAFVVGRRFRLAHIRFGRDRLVEVATFRRKPEAGELPENPEDHFAFQENVFGTPEQDASRRDFTINALFYDIASFSVIDHVGGLEDLALRRLRVIGDPRVRFNEDPVRMLRALEFCARLGFSLDGEAREGIYTCAPLIAEAAPARIREEVQQLFRYAVAAPVLRDAAATGLLEPLLGGYQVDETTLALLEAVDERTRGGQAPEEPFVLAALYLARFRRAVEDVRGPITEVVRLAGLVLSPHCRYFSIARGIAHQARELLVGFYRLGRGRRQRGERRLLANPMTPFALELLTLWSQISGESGELVHSWRQALSGKETPPAPKETAGEAPKKSPRRRRRGGKRRSGGKRAPAEPGS